MTMIWYGEDFKSAQQNFNLKILWELWATNPSVAISLLPTRYCCVVRLIFGRYSYNLHTYLLSVHNGLSVIDVPFSKIYILVYWVCTLSLVCCNVIVISFQKIWIDLNHLIMVGSGWFWYLSRILQV